MVKRGACYRTGIAGILAAALIVLPGEADASIPTCHGKRATLIGTSGNDRLRSDHERFVVVAKSGDDFIYTPDASDYWDFTYDTEACGWGGNDTFVGYFDYIDGGSGFDVATVSACVGTEIRNIEKVILVGCTGPDR